jgi:hypothetical protein
MFDILSLGLGEKLAQLSQLMDSPTHCASLSSLHTSQSSSSIGMFIYAISILIRDSDLSPIIDIHLPSPSMKKTHGRQTSYQGACIAKLSISRATHPVKSAGNTPLSGIRGGGRGWLCYFLMKKKRLEVAKIFELLWFAGANIWR